MPSITLKASSNCPNYVSPTPFFLNQALQCVTAALCWCALIKKLKKKNSFSTASKSFDGRLGLNVLREAVLASISRNEQQQDFSLSFLAPVMLNYRLLKDGFKNFPLKTTEKKSVNDGLSIIIMSGLSYYLFLHHYFGINKAPCKNVSL